MKKTLFLFTLLALFNSCSDINNKNISSLNYLPAESELILNINDLKNTKEIMIEKHVKLKNSKGPDASTSITVEELSKLILHIKLIEKSKLN